MSSGVGRSPQASPGECTNCSAPLHGEYCSSCGQRARDPRGSLLRLAGSAFGEWTGIDGKVPRTLALLFSQPGALTERYLAGQRVRYLTPFRLYTIASLFFFFFFSFSAPDASNWNIYIDDEQIGSAPKGSPGGRLRLDYPDEDERFGKAFAARREKILAMEPQEIVDRLFDRLEEALPIALILFVPLLALAIKLFHPRRWLFDHLIFALHHQSFLFIVLIVPRFFGSVFAFLAVFALAGPLYLLLALKRVYRRSTAATFATTAALSLLYIALLALSLGSQLIWVFVTL